MARGLIPRLAALCLAALALGGCVSTDELYAEYDTRACRFVVESRAADGVLTLREQISNSYYRWEPAVYFDFNASTLDAVNASLLDAAVEVLTRFPDLNVSLQGFTDRFGSSSYNAYLAGLRVATVRRRLEERGIAALQIVSQPLGEGLPVFGDDDRRARAINRRVELMLLDETGRPVHPLFDFSALENAQDRRARAAQTPFDTAPVPGSVPADGAVPAADGDTRP